MHTSLGTIELELFDDDAPKTVENFRKLAGDGFYDGIIFHRIISDFMIQGGCPQGTGTGGPGYTFEDEINPHKVARGALAMANAGPNTNGSQFFIVTTDSAPWLDAKHTVFGQETSGMETVDAIEGLPTDARDRPLEPPVIESIELDPAEGARHGGRLGRRAAGRRARARLLARARWSVLHDGAGRPGCGRHQDRTAGEWR